MIQDKEQIFLDLQEELKAGIEAYERGECVPLDEAIVLLSSTN